MSKVVKVMEWIDAGIFPATIMFSCGFSFDEIVALLKKKKAIDWLEGLTPEKEFIEGSNYCYVSVVLTDSKSGSETKLFYIIVRERFQFTDEEYCKLAHEVLHICQQVLPDLLDRNKEHEAEAYLHTHVMSQCLKALRG